MEAEAGLLDNLKDYFSFRLGRKKLFIIFVSALGFFIWFFGLAFYGPVIYDYLNGLNALSIEKGRILQQFLISMLITGFISGYIIQRTSKKILFQWLATLVASISTFYLFTISNINQVFPVAILFGVCTGLFLTAWGTGFADNTAPEDRGRLMGLILACSFPTAYLFYLLDSTPIGTKILFIGGIYLATSSVALLNPRDIQIDEREARRNRGMGTRQLTLYSIPIVLFYIVFGILFSIVFPTIQNNVSHFIFYVTISIPFFFGAIVGGYLLDMKGRKFPMILGLAITGISLAILGIVDIKHSYLAIIPLAVGLSIFTISTFIIWGDLAPMKERGLYFGLGIGLMALALLVGLIISGTVFGSISEGKMKSNMFYSAVSLFLCIPPLIVAEDALPREIIEKRQLEEHIKRARERIRKK